MLLNERLVMRTGLCLRVTAAVIASATLTLTAIVAPAASTASPDTSGEHLKVSMTLRGFNHEVAAANGFEIRSTADGREYSVLRGIQSNRRQLRLLLHRCDQ